MLSASGLLDNEELAEIGLVALAGIILPVHEEEVDARGVLGNVRLQAVFTLPLAALAVAAGLLSRRLEDAHPGLARARHIEAEADPALADGVGVGDARLGAQAFEQVVVRLLVRLGGAGGSGRAAGGRAGRGAGARGGAGRGGGGPAGRDRAG